MSTSPEEIYAKLKGDIRKKHLSDFKELREKIANLFQGKLGKEVVKKIVRFSHNSERNINYSSDIDEIISSKSANLTAKQKSLLFLFWYLWITEGVFSEVIETIAFLLMQKHHDIYDPRNMEYVKNYKELEKIDLFVKLQFLKKHGFDFLCGCIDRNLRNLIAHTDIAVNDDGSIVNIKNGKQIPNLEESITLLMVTLLEVLTAINENMRKHFKTIKR